MSKQAFYEGMQSAAQTIRRLAMFIPNDVSPAEALRQAAELLDPSEDEVVVLTDIEAALS